MLSQTENDRLAIAVERGIITAEQAAYIRLIEPDGIARERYSGDHASDGKVIEHYIARMIGGALTSEQSEYDVLTKRGDRLEIKWSRYRQNQQASVSRKWAWGGVLGRSNQKTYDYLVLAGEIDPDKKDAYRMSEGQPFVLFIIPFYEVENFSNPSDGKRLLNLTTNRTWGVVNKKMYDEYMVDENDVVSMFA